MQWDTESERGAIGISEGWGGVLSDAKSLEQRRPFLNDQLCRERRKKWKTETEICLPCNGCPTPGACVTTEGCATAGMMVPTYYVAHPDGSYSIANPQPLFVGRHANRI